MSPSVIQAEQTAFQLAKEEIACGDSRASGIEVMMRLATDAKTGVKGWARTYLRQMMNVQVLDTTNEAPSATDRVQGSLPDCSA